MKQFNGFKAKKIASTTALPVGGYVAEIKEVKDVFSANGTEFLQISFEIAEGEYKGFFEENYKNQQSEDKRWKGVHRLFVPKDDGSDKDEWSKKIFGDAIACIEESNSGYHWDWNESGLKGKLIGVLFREKEWEYDGRTGITTECGKLETIANVREGKFKPLKGKYLAKPAPSVGFAPVAFDDDELPF